MNNYASFCLSSVFEIRVVGSGEYVRNFLCNLEREYQDAEDERLEKIRQDIEHDYD